MYELVLNYIRMGLSVIPVNTNKKPVLSRWAQYQQTAINEDDFSAMWSSKKWTQWHGVALIGGKVSGGLECIDVDCKYDETGELWKAFYSELVALPFFQNLVIATTQNKGYHVFYRCSEVSGNLKLAERPASEKDLEKANAQILQENIKSGPDKQKQPHTSIKTLPNKVLIETRGEGGYFLVYPSQGYSIQNLEGMGETLANPITPDERKQLFDLAISFDYMHKPTEQPIPKIEATPFVSQLPTMSLNDKAPQPKTSANSVASVDTRPGDDFNSSHSALTLLEQYGSCYARGMGVDSNKRQIQHLCNSADGESNGYYYPADNKIFLFSANYVAGGKLETEKAYTAFELYTVFEHNGDYSAAAKALAKQGFGTKASKPKKDAPNPKPIAPTAHAVSDGDALTSNPYFRVLGFDKTDNGVQAFYFYRKGRYSVVIRLTASGMTKNNLLTLAPLNFWESTFPKGKGSGLDVDAAMDYLISEGQRIGHFGMHKIRGRGAWYDNNAVVIHTGDKLIVSGKDLDFETYQSEFIYESAERLGIGVEDPLPTTESTKFLNICKTPSWERDNNGVLLAGWCVIAPVCGALPWRPHLWIIGESGTGKSTVFKGIVKKMLGLSAISVQSNTSESGIRQKLQHDARPVIFDEAEAEDKASQDRMTAVLGLMRASSSDEGGQIIKGGQDGQAKAYDIRACFASASIGFPATQQSDLRRITVLSTKKIRDKAKASELIKSLNKQFEILTPEYINRFQARTVHMLPTILKNASIFAKAVIEVIGQQWAGDQLGIILAGAHSLEHEDVVEYEQALKIVSAMNWAEENALEEQPDQIRLLATIVEQPVRLEMGRERVVSELILIASNNKSDSDISLDAAHDQLKRLGIKIEECPFGKHQQVLFANTAVWIKKVLQHTPWAANHAKVLSRIEGAKAVPSKRFSALVACSVGVPLSLFTGESENTIYSL